MSLITRCPACETMFKVVPDQLRISDGWARCGQCGEIFDASLQLITAASFEAGAPATAPPVATGEIAASMAEPAAALQDAPAGASSSYDAETSSDVSSATEVPPDFVMARSPALPEESPATEATSQPHPLPSPPASTSSPSSPLPSAPSPTALAAPASDSVPAPDPAATDFVPTEASEDASHVSFMRGTEKPSPWRRRGVRIFLLVLLVLLLAALAIQFLLQERNRIAAIEPSARPLLLVLCAMSRCAVEPVRQIESIVIDSSSFSRLKGETYRLAFALRNNATLDLAMPAVELALTDAQDRAVVRRVIGPAEFGASSPVLPAGSDWSGSLSMDVQAGAGVDRIAGYRLLAFYP